VTGKYGLATQVTSDKAYPSLTIHSYTNRPFETTTTSTSRKGLIVRVLTGSSRLPLKQRTANMVEVSSFNAFMDDLNIRDVDLNDDLMEFIENQKEDYATALKEIKGGEKSGHWIWYIMPQEQISSQNNFRLNIAKAKVYLKFNEDGINLGKNYLEIMKEVEKQIFENGIEPSVLMGGDPDDRKLTHSLELFFAATHKSKDGSLEEEVNRVCGRILTHVDLEKYKERFKGIDLRNFGFQMSDQIQEKSEFPNP